MRDYKDADAKFIIHRLCSNALEIGSASVYQHLNKNHTMCHLLICDQDQDTRQSFHVGEFLVVSQMIFLSQVTHSKIQTINVKPHIHYTPSSEMFRR